MCASAHRPETIIAVDVESKDLSALQSMHNYGDGISGWRLAWNQFNPFSVERAPQFHEVLLYLQCMGHSRHLRSIRSDMLDLYIRPRVQQYDLMDYIKLPEIEELGYETGKRALVDWLRRHPRVASMCSAFAASHVRAPQLSSSPPPSTASASAQATSRASILASAEGMRMAASTFPSVPPAAAPAASFLSPSRSTPSMSKFALAGGIQASPSGSGMRPLHVSGRSESTSRLAHVTRYQSMMLPSHALDMSYRLRRESSSGSGPGSASRSGVASVHGSLANLSSFLSGHWMDPASASPSPRNAALPAIRSQVNLFPFPPTVEK